MKQFKTPQFLQDDSSLYYVIIAALIIVILIEKMYTTAIVSGLILLFTIILNSRKKERRKRELKKYIIDFTNDVDSLSRQTLLSFPMPLIIINKDGDVYWYNSKFKEILGNRSSHLENILDFYSNFPLKFLDDEDNIINIDVNTKNYNILYNNVETNKNESNMYILYWIDNTAFTTLKNLYNDERAVPILVQIDNYNEISQKMDKVVKASMVAKIEKLLSTQANRMNGFLVRYETSKFVMIIENKFINNLETKKFDILEEVKEIRSENDEYFTLSIGVGAYAKSLAKQYENAKGSLDIALGRGGDQAVVKRINKVQFYGGKSKAVEKRTKVKARMIAYALRQIIDQSSNVMIMGHKIGDLDSFGASIGVFSIVKSRNRKGYIIMDEVNPALKNIFERIEKEEDELYKSVIINTETALKLIDDETVCIILDTHKASFTESPEIIEKTEKVVLIDHHRRSEEYVDNPVLDYIEPYASSTCELVSEIIQYIGYNIELTKFEADALLSGIVLDTNAFTFKTGVRTFEAASFLRRNGADTIEVSKLFSENMETTKKKSEVVEKAEVKFKEIAISTLDELYENGLVIAAQCADELLTVKGIKASFVLSKQKGYINISGRSVGEINVQVILELLGGGGHLTTAGAQLETEDMKLAKKKLCDAIKEYRKENDKNESNTT